MITALLILAAFLLWIWLTAHVVWHALDFTAPNALVIIFGWIGFSLILLFGATT